jgi:hypothetical protein
MSLGAFVSFLHERRRAMKLESVMELKRTIEDTLQVEEGRRRGNQLQGLVNPKTAGRLAVGYSQRAKSEYQLEFRVQRYAGAAHRKAERFKSELAHDEANIEIIPLIEIPARSAIEAITPGSALRGRKRPLHIGLSIGHASGGAGTLGAFVGDDDGREYILSNNHVLALMGQAKLHDPIYQPGRPDEARLMARHTVGELFDFSVVSREEHNDADSAVALLVDGIDHDGNKIPAGIGASLGGKSIASEAGDPVVLGMQKDETLCKIGRTTGFTEGRLSAIALSNVPVRTPIGNVLFDNVIEINWTSPSQPFTQPGDSGSLVFTKKGLIPIGLHFAGGLKRIAGKDVGVSYSCSLATVLAAHDVSLLE